MSTPHHNPHHSPGSSASPLPHDESWSAAAGSTPDPSRGLAPSPPWRRKFIAGLAVGVIGAASGIALVATGNDSDADSGEARASATPSPSATSYGIRLPATLLGQYERSTDEEWTDKAGAHHEWVAYFGKPKQIRVVTTALAKKERERRGYEVLDDLRDTKGLTVEVDRRVIHPAGGGDPLACEVHAQKEDGEVITVPVCSWEDSRTQGTVTNSSYEVWHREPLDVDLDALARETDAIRDEVRTKQGKP